MSVPLSKGLGLPSDPLAYPRGKALVHWWHQEKSLPWPVCTVQEGVGRGECSFHTTQAKSLLFSLSSHQLRKLLIDFFIMIKLFTYRKCCCRWTSPHKSMPRTLWADPATWHNKALITTPLRSAGLARGLLLMNFTSWPRECGLDFANQFELITFQKLGHSLQEIYTNTPSI